MARFHYLAITASLVALQVSPGPAVAQTSVEQTSPQQPSVSQSTIGQLQEIVVTAEKRQSSVQATPLSLTAISGADLDALGMSSAQDIVRAVPGISVASAGPGQADYEIRGIAATGGDSPTVGFYLDDIAISPPTLEATGLVQIDPSLYDLARVEVLRGPQGTLYGAGAMGGAIKLITNQPNPDQFATSLRAKLSETAGGGLNYGFDATVNLPISDDVAVRLVGTHKHRSGWIDRIVEPNLPLPTNGGTTRGDVLASSPKLIVPDVNDELVNNVRASLLFAPSSRAKITPMIMYQEIGMGGYDTYDDPPGPSEMGTYQPLDVPESFYDRFILYSLPATYSFDSFSVTSDSGYWSRRTSQWQDDSQEVQALLQPPAYSAAAGGVGVVRPHELDNTDQFSEEVRLSSIGDGPLQWMIGGYYADFHYHITLDLSNVPGLATTEGGAFGTSDFAYEDLRFELRQEAAFVNASYKFTPALRLEAGVRYFTYQAAQNEVSEGLAFGEPTPALAGGTAANSGTDPMVDLSYTASRDLMLYARVAKGFRAGGPNFPIPTNGAPGSIGATCLQDLEALGRTSAPSQFGPDSVWNYELGEKSQFLGRRLIVDSDVYYIRWSGVQQSIALSCGLPFTANASTAAVKGGESEIAVKLLPSLTLMQSMGYTHAAFVGNVPAVGVVSGQALYNVPRWTLSTNLSYERRIGSRRLVGLISNSYSSSMEDLSYEVNHLPARDRMNLRIGVESDRASIYVYVDNVLNRHNALEDITLLGLTGPTFNRVATDQPLTGGVELDWRF